MTKLTNEQFARLVELTDNVSKLHLMPMDTMQKEYSPCLVYGISRCAPNHILPDGICGKGFVQAHWIMDEQEWQLMGNPNGFEPQGWLPMPPTNVVGL